MGWIVKTHIDFDEEFQSFPEEVQNNIVVKAIFIKEVGPSLGRPLVDTLKGSKHANMKELRVEASAGVWRVAFAFDPKRQAIMLVAGDKAGKATKRFYKNLIRVADMRFDEHLEYLKANK